MAVSTAPMVWPVSRAVPSMPPAAPARSRGAAVSIMRLLGDWKRPKPSAAQGHAPADVDGRGVGRQHGQGHKPDGKGQRARRRRAAAEDSRSASQPASGAATATAAGHGRQQQAGGHLAAVQRCSRNGTAGRRRPASGPRTRRSRSATESAKIAVAQQVERHQRAAAATTRGGRAWRRPITPDRELQPPRRALARGAASPRRSR